MLGSQALDRVKANCNELLAKLKTNFDEHKKLYAELYSAYQKKAAVLLKERAQELESSSPASYAVNLQFEIEPPDDHRQDYERAIGMLELHMGAGEETIHITPALYAAYMQDIWGWEEQFWAKNTTMYGVRRRR